MKTLFQEALIDREFGRAAVRTADLRKWAADHAAAIPPTIPAIDGFDVLHLESLLCAIERAVPALGAAVASHLAAELPPASLNPRIAAISVEVAPQWMVGADVHQQWRGRLVGAIALGELRPVDVLSGLPVEPTHAVAAAASPSVHKPPGAGVVTHRMKTRGRDTLDTVIDLAQSKCTDPGDTAQVWAQLQVLADSESPPLLASTSEGLKYKKVKGKDAYFTRDALDKRLHPEKRKLRR